MASGSGIKLSHILVPVGILLVIVLVAGMFMPALNVCREDSRRIRCRNNLNQLAKGMATYLNECGENDCYPWPAGRPGCGTVANPDFGGAEWLASLYWTRIIPDPGVYNCPSSPDSNEQGKMLGSVGCPSGKRLDLQAVSNLQAVSYAAFGNRSVGIYMVSKQGKAPGYAKSSLAVREDFPANEPMACDDTDEPINHGERDNGGMAVLFFDSHVEYWTHTRVDLETGVGQGDLCALRN
ncbi:MAG TPA: hypothetical protein VNE39_23670 [Planctomycetota bacterium]|nr:hypothetical protein [Planctomycetota bacterium]